MGIVQKIREVFKIGQVKNIGGVITLDDNITNYIEQHIYRWNNIYMSKPPWQTKSGTINAAKTLCSFIADLNFNEYSITVESNRTEEEAQKVLDNILDYNLFKYNIRNFGEQIEALGGGALKPYNDGEKIMIDFVSAENFIPLSWNNRGVQEGIFVSRKRQHGKIYTLLEIHTITSDGLIQINNRLFSSGKAEFIGVEIADINSIDGYEMIQPEILINRDKPLFSYVFPALANNLCKDIPFGISRFANSVNTLEAVDSAFDELQSERLKASKKIFASKYMLKRRMEEDGNASVTYDKTTDIYQILNIDTKDNQMPVAFDPSFKIAEHTQDINTQLNILSFQIGLSNGSLSFDASSQGIKTATEIKSENSKTFRLVEQNQAILKEGLQDLFDSVLFLAQELGLLKAGDYASQVVFDDSITPDRETFIKEGRELVADGLITKEYFLTQYYKLTENQASKMISELPNPIPDIFGDYSDETTQNIVGNNDGDK